jgi:hypothetical protein
MSENSIPAPFELHHDAFGRLVLTDADGRLFPAVEVVRSFPISDPGRCVSLCDADGHELIWIDRLEEVHEPARRVIEEELARREFVPVVHRIVHVSAPVDPSEWDVETDRGPTHFVVNSEDDVRRLDGRRAMIIDAHGVRYLIPDTRALDGGSRRLLERYL